ncbi:MAG: metallophosphoesterase [Thermosphaera sp.]
MRRKIIFMIVLASIILITTANIPPATAQANEVLPGLIYDVGENLFNEIGPALPAISPPGASITLSLTSSFQGLQISGAYMTTAKSVGDTTVFLNYTLSVENLGNGQVIINIPPNVDEGLYDLIVISNSSRYNIKRSLWIMSNWPNTLRIAVMTDLHFLTGSPDTMTGDINRVSAFTLANLLNPDLIFWLGDIADTAAPYEYLAAQSYRYYLLYRYPVIGIPGNHDAPEANYKKYLGPTYWYRILGNNLLVIGLFSAEGGTPTWEQIVFLEEVLANYSSIPFKAILVHHPMFYYQGELYTWYNDTETLKPYSPGVNTPVSSYWSNNMTAFRYVLKLIEDYNVTFVLSGHVHRDFFTKYNSIRTNTTTYFMTFTTTAHGSASYCGIGYFEFNLLTGEISFPITPPTFIGFRNSTRPLALNSIPIGLYPPTNNLGWSNRTYLPVNIVQSNNSYIISFYNNLSWLNLTGKIMWLLPWNGTMVGYIINPENTAGINSVLKDGILYVAISIDLRFETAIEIYLYNALDLSPPDILVKTYSPRPPYLNRSFTLYLGGIDQGWGIKSASFMLIDGSNTTMLKYTQSPSSYTQKMNDVTFTLQFTVSSTTTKSVLLNASIADYSGRVRIKIFNITFIPYGAQPPATPITVVSDTIIEPVTETPSPTTTSPPTETTTTTTLPYTETMTTTTTTATTTQTTTTPQTETTTTPTTIPTTTLETTMEVETNQSLLIGALIVGIIIIASIIYVFFLRK